MNKNIHSIDQSSSSLSVESLEEIVRNCQRNEQRLHELKRRTRHERKKAERLLRETYRIKQERDKQMSTSQNNENLKSKQQPVEFFVSLDNDDNNTNYQSRRENKTQRVRFNIPENDHDVETEQKKSTTNNDELADLSRRCEDLLSNLNTDLNQARIFENSDDYSERLSPSLENDHLVTLQQSLELLRPEFISHSRERVQRINHLREEREHQQSSTSFDSNSILHRNIQSNSSFQVPLTYQEMKQESKKKYEQLPEVNERLRQGLINEIKQRNYLRAKIFRTRLRQHVLLHGRTNIDESLTMIDT